MSEKRIARFPVEVSGHLKVHLDNGSQWYPSDEDLLAFGLVDAREAFENLVQALRPAFYAVEISPEELPLLKLVEAIFCYGADHLPSSEKDDLVADVVNQHKAAHKMRDLAEAVTMFGVAQEHFPESADLEAFVATIFQDIVQWRSATSGRQEVKGYSSDE